MGVLPQIDYTLPVISYAEQEFDFDTLLDRFSPRPYKDCNDFLDSGWTYNIHLDMVLTKAIEDNASDIHIVADQTICYTVLGDIIKQDCFEIPDRDTMYALVQGILSHEAMGSYVKDLEYDTSYTIRQGDYRGRRFRVNLGRSFDSDILTFRTISDTIPMMNTLGIDESISDLFQISSGIVLVCGATGSGKSTTLASILRNIQLTDKKKIITVENPIEYIYPTDGKSLVVQREIPGDCLSFGDGLTSAMRSAPNIILIGEVRNRSEVDELLRASETGHLALSTIHTSNNITTLNRIRSLYSGDEQRRVLSTLGDNLRGIVNQVLVKSTDGQSRFAVREILPVDFQIRKLIQQDKLSEIRKMQETAKTTMEHKLIHAYKSGKCTREQARSKAPDQSYFDYLDV